MAGLLNPPGANRPLPSPPPQPGGGMGMPMPDDPRQRDTVGDDEGSETETSGPASPEEQDEYDQFVNAAYRLIYQDGKVNPNIVKLLDNDPQDLIAILGSDSVQHFSPVVALASTAVVVVQEVIAQSGQKPDGQIIVHAGKEILEDLAALAKTTKVHDFTQDELNNAMLYAVNLYRSVGEAKGQVDQQALSQEFADILNAQDKGKLSKMLPGIERYDNGGVR